MTLPDHEYILRALLRDKIHVRPETLARLPTAEADRLGSPLDLARMLLQPLQRAPLAMLDWWRLHPRGHVVIGPVDAGYVPGPQPVGRRTLDCVAWVAARELLAGDRLPTAAANLFDHLLGSDGDPDGPWLSDGGGRSALWQEVGARVQRQRALGYAPRAVQDNPHDYLAWGLCTFLADRQQLNAVDPGLERLLATTVFDAAFWGRTDHAVSG
ncbi:MAG: hypothetical protein R2844_16935 [Caldilineales bacterium]